MSNHEPDGRANEDNPSADDLGANADGYDEAQRQRLIDAASEVLVAAVAAEPSGPIAYFREVLAAGRYLYDARRQYADNALVQQLFAHTEERPVELETVTRQSLLASITEVGAIVHDDDEGREFKDFLVALAERIARASRGGLFGRRITDDEAAFLADLRAALEMSAAGSDDHGTD